jgi:hypothetical protein
MEELKQRHGEDRTKWVPAHTRFIDVNLLTTAAVVLSAMAAEAFLNFYGVKRMGQVFYDLHYERLGLVPKLSAVVETCCGVLLDEKADIVSVARDLSEARNRLAHPKTREVKPDAKVLQQPPKKIHVDVARDSVANMTQFFKLFASIDPDAGDVVHAI